MRFLFPYFLIFLVVFQFFLRKNSRKDDERTRLFWEKENQSNSVRKKDISSLDYIKIPDSLPYIETTNPDITKAQNDFKKYSDKKMLNLTGLSNTDLKFSYGVANLTLLTEYDDNCADMLKSLVKLSSVLLDNNYTSEAIKFLEFGIKCNTDITNNYLLLAKCYSEVENINGIKQLIEKANNLDSMSKDSIIKKLNDYLPN